MEKIINKLDKIPTMVDKLTLTRGTSRYVDSPTFIISIGSPLQG